MKGDKLIFSFSLVIVNNVFLLDLRMEKLLKCKIKSISAMTFYGISITRVHENY